MEKIMKTEFITRLGVLSAILLSITGRPLLAQTLPQQQLRRAFVLEKENKPAPAITILKALLDSQTLDVPDSGKARNILGLAYEDLGEFSLSQHAYEESIRILRSDPDIRNYAMALNDFGGMYLAMGQLDTAQKMKVKALGQYERVDDHGGIARASYDLAEIEFGRGKVPEGTKYLERALKEARSANDLDEDDWAAISSLQGWQAEIDGDHKISIARYKQALDLWRKLHGEEHPDTGWGLVLLGAADAEGGHSSAGLAEMKQGVAILGRTLGQRNLRYLSVEVTYARLLEREGFHAEAAQVKTATEPVLQEVYREQCVGCTVSAAALR
jgi:tetratricopeptide (TPR) repeat protein